MGIESAALPVIQAPPLPPRCSDLAQSGVWLIAARLPAAAAVTVQLSADAARFGRPSRALCGSTLSAQALRIRQNAGRGGGGKHMGPVAKLLRLA